MNSKASKSKRKEEKVQQLEKELSSIKKKNNDSVKTIRIEQEQFNELLENLSEQIDSSVGRIIEESKRPPFIVTKHKKTDATSILIRYLLSGLFCCFGIVLIVSIFANWGQFWTGGTSNIATIIVLFMGLTCIIIGMDIFREKDRNYLIALFSAFVALVALIITLIK